MQCLAYHVLLFVLPLSCCMEDYTTNALDHLCTMRFASIRRRSPSPENPGWVGCRGGTAPQIPKFFSAKFKSV
eukprot:1641453-Amphidinium_carterae.4